MSTKPPREPDRLVWIDLEMSGLDVERCRILEIAALVTDGALALVAEGPDLVVHEDEAVLAAMDEWNTQHHGASGLTQAVRESRVELAEAEERVLAFVAAHCAPQSAPLAGNSVWMDRLFLRRYMPRLEGYLHYRIVDVSTVKELARRWVPAAAASLPPKAERHRALDDIRESVAELAHYRHAAFRST